MTKLTDEAETMIETLREMTNREKLGDPVNQPNHYTTGEVEVIDYIRDKLTDEEFVGYCSGNVLKYISRWRHKGGIEDLRKAAVYLNWQIEALVKVSATRPKVEPTEFVD